LADSSEADMAREDEFDDRGRFWLATADNATPIGIVRGNRLSDGFPHRDLLEHHLLHPGVAPIAARLCTINGLAVRAPYRHTRFEARYLGWRGHLARLLMLALIRQLEEEGMEAAIATAGTAISARLCESIGFLAIDPPFKTSLHPDLKMINVGLVFGTPKHIKAQQECEMGPGKLGLTPEATGLSVYFESRNGALLGGRPVVDVLKGDR
jgi:hypothetical protein